MSSVPLAILDAVLPNFRLHLKCQRLFLTSRQVPCYNSLDHLYCHLYLFNVCFLHETGNSEDKNCFFLPATDAFNKYMNVQMILFSLHNYEGALFPILEMTTQA